MKVETFAPVLKIKCVCFASVIAPLQSLVRIPPAHSGPQPTAHILSGDVITRVNGQPVRSLAEFKAVAAGVVAGQPVALSVLRGGEPLRVVVRTAEADGFGVQPGTRHCQKVGRGPFGALGLTSKVTECCSACECN